jgi:ABC-type dipeptide/oligopeptide/nickel transport system permease subunit
VLDSGTRARLLRNRSAVAGGAMVAALALLALVGPWIAPHGPLESDFVRGVSPDLTPVGPCAAFPLGADRLFRDVFARLWAAGRLSLVVAIASTAMASLIGVVVGIASGWYEGVGARVPWAVCVAATAAAAEFGAGHCALALLAVVAGAVTWLAGARRGPVIDVDGWLMRAVDAFLAFPFLLLVMALGASLENTTAVTIAVTLGATGWLGMARVVRAKTLQVRALDFVEAARALGAPTPQLLARHVLPNVAGTWVVTSTVLVAQMIVYESALSYLGVGIAPPTPTWGRMLFEGQEVWSTAPWLIMAPGAAILSAAWAFNLLGDGLRDALDAGI